MRRLTRGIVVMALSSASFSVNAAKKQTANAKNSHERNRAILRPKYGRSQDSVWKHVRPVRNDHRT
jgi:hypothetical protein